MAKQKETKPKEYPALQISGLLQTGCPPAAKYKHGVGVYVMQAKDGQPMVMVGTTWFPNGGESAAFNRNACMLSPTDAIKFAEMLTAAALEAKAKPVAVS